MKAHLADGYARRKDGTVDAKTPAKEHAGRGCKVPPGGLYTTPGDLTRFLAVLIGASPTKLLSNESLTETLKIQVSIDEQTKYSIGFKIVIEPDGSHLFLCNGNIAGYAARAIFEPNMTLGIMLFRNYNQRQGEDLQMFCLDLIRKLIAAQKTV
jgi:hypothetical protein